MFQQAISAPLAMRSPMPVINRQDASDVEQHIARIFSSNSPEERVREIRRLFVEKLDFEQSSGVVSLGDAPASVELPDEAHQVASLQEAHVVYVHLETSRVRKAEASEAARLVSNQLAGDILMVFTNRDASQLHLICPTFEGIRPTLRRMVIERDLPRRTAVMQVANIFHEWERTGSIHVALESAFDVEAVTREFFKEYKRVFDAALDKIGGFGRDESEQEAKKLFTQTLFQPAHVRLFRLAEGLAEPSTATRTTSERCGATTPSKPTMRTVNPTSDTTG